MPLLAVNVGMNTIKIIEYKNEMKESVRSLFQSIYPDNSFLAQKMSYDENISNHVTTKIALQSDIVIGQANILEKQNWIGMQI